MAGRGRLPGPLIPRFPAASFRLMTTPTYKVTPPWMPESPPTPGPPPSQRKLVPTTGWRFNPLDPATPACKAVQHTLDQELELFPPGSCQDAREQPAKKEPNDQREWDKPQRVVQVGYQGARHWRFPHSKSYGPVMEHAVAGLVGINAPLHPKGESGLEFQVALAFLYDLSYENDRQQSQEAYLDHSMSHGPRNLQLVVQLSYLWPFFLKKIGKDKESILDFSLLGQIVGADNWAYDYDGHQMQMAKQLQFVLGASMTIKPLAHQEKLPEFWRGFSISCGPQGGVTTLADPNTFDFSWVCSVGVPSP